jgi:site-specific DNA-cytosine methylase
MKMFDLYSGIGGFILAASWCRYIVISGYHETDPYCRKVLCENFPLLKRYQHPKEIREKIDLLTATVKRDANGKTNWQTIYKVIKLTRPTWIVIEGCPWISIACRLIWRVKNTEKYRSYYQLVPSVLRKDQTGYGLLPNLRKEDAHFINIGKTTKVRKMPNGALRRYTKNGTTASMSLGRLIHHKTGLTLTPELLESMQGYPMGWTKL